MPDAKRPNILYLHSHDTGRYVQPYGYAVPTPNLQRFAEQGVLFRQAFCANPTCSASRASLLTGQCAHSNGMLGLAHRGWQLHDARQSLPHTLRPHGYHTVACGPQHVARDISQVGYDRKLEAKSESVRHVAPAAEAFLHERPREPFFFSCGFFETHREFPEPGPDDDPRYVRPPAPLPDTGRTRRDMAGYITMARTLDDGMGRVLKALDDAGLAQRTLVIVTTDHGLAFPGMKCNLTDHGIGVMLMMRGPAGSGFEGGRALDAMVSHVDLFPTICDLLQIAPPPWLQGKSMLPLVRGEVDRLHDEIFAEVNYHAAYEPQRCVRTERYKYIRRFDDRDRPVLPNCDDSPSKDEWLDHGWRDRAPDREQLYDLAFDPNEAGNLAHRPDMKPVLDDLRARLQRWMEATDDPILRGPIPPPSGARLNDLDALSPNEPTYIAP